MSKSLQGEPPPLERSTGNPYIHFKIEFHRKRSRICANQGSRAVHCAIQIYQTSITEKVSIDIHFWKVKKQSRLGEIYLGLSEYPGTPPLKKVFNFYSLFGEQNRDFFGNFMKIHS